MTATSRSGLVLLLAYVGLRIGEAFALRRWSVNVLDGSITVTESLADVSGTLAITDPKNHQSRTVNVPPFLMARLLEHLDRVGDAPSAFLFTGRAGKPLRYSSWRRNRFDPARAAADRVTVTPHDLRATHATWVADAHRVLVAAKRLGHSSSSVTTRHYARAVADRDQAVIDSLEAQAMQAAGTERGT